MSLGESGRSCSEGFLCELPFQNRRFEEINVVVTDQFSLESSTYFYTSTQCCHPLLTDFANTYSLGMLCRGTQIRICGSLVIVLSGKMPIPSVNWTYFTKLSSFNLKRDEAEADPKLPHKMHMYQEPTNLFWRLQATSQSPSAHSATFLFVHSMSGIRSVIKLEEKAKQLNPLHLSYKTSAISWHFWASIVGLRK